MRTGLYGLNNTMGTRMGKKVGLDLEGGGEWGVT